MENRIRELGLDGFKKKLMLSHPEIDGDKALEDKSG